MSEASFDNLPSPMRQTLPFKEECPTEKSMSSRLTLIPKTLENPSTYHFKIDIQKDQVAMKRETYEDDEFGLDPVDKTLKVSIESESLFPKRVSIPAEKILRRQQNQSKLMLFMV